MDRVKQRRSSAAAVMYVVLSAMRRHSRYFDAFQIRGTGRNNGFWRGTPDHVPTKAEQHPSALRVRIDRDEVSFR
jgi:hypothetical protein